MINIRLLLCGFILLAGTLTSGVALADRHGHGHGGHVGLGLYFGVPYSYPYYPPYYYPYPYYPPTVIAPAEPPVYIEQGRQSSPQTTYSWYHCDNPEGYYPYIKTCPGGWKEVSPTPPPQQ